MMNLTALVTELAEERAHLEHLKNEGQEEWRDVVGWEGKYEVSSLGRVRGVARTVMNGGVPMRVKERMLRAAKGSAGYPMVYLGQGELVHRLVAEAFLGPIPPDHYVHHVDHDKMNPRLSNLAVISPSENMAAAHAAGVLLRDGPL